MYGLPLWLWWAFAAVATGLGVLIAGRAIFLDRSRGRRRCPRCWYDMSGTARGPDGWTCPECGRLTTRERRLLRTRRRKRLATLGLILILCAPGVWLTQYQHKHGWWSITPTPILMWIAVRQESRTTTPAQNHLLDDRLPHYYRPGLLHDFLVSQAQVRLGPECTFNQRLLSIGSLGILAARGKGLEALLTIAAGANPDDSDAALRALKNARPPVEAIARLGQTMLSRSSPAIGSELFVLLHEYAHEFSEEDAEYFRAKAMHMVEADPHDVGAAAALLLRKLQPLSDATIDRLLTILDQTRHNPRWPAVATLLAGCGPPASRAVPILIDRMENGGAGNLATPILVCGRLGTTAAAAAPLLERHVDRGTFEGFDARCARSAVLGEQPSMLHACIARLEHPDERLSALQALGRLGFWCGEDISIVRPRVEFLLSDADPDIRKAAALYMWWLEERAAPSLPALRAAKSDPDPEVRRVAASAIQHTERALYLKPPATSPRTPPP